MKNFGRVLRLALRYRLTLVGVFFCSLMVAVFWGGNIGGVYPIVEVAMRGKSLQVWVAEEIARADAAAVEIRREIERLQKAPRPGLHRSPRRGRSVCCRGVCRRNKPPRRPSAG